MDKAFFELFAAMYGGECLNMEDVGWCAVITHPDGSMFELSQSGVRMYANDMAYVKRTSNYSIGLQLPDDSETFVAMEPGKPNEKMLAVDTSGSHIISRGWVHEEDAQQEADGLSSRGEGRHVVVPYGDGSW